ncbi:SDR family NAD(P)-dependent oxidoreductase [Streptomyces sp. NPDC002596]|uniref:SDR family NAD(P)-dependent oxidoreductase n=1 Tax=unclassified Streptomyces TaxID=2593676 RepID=UPI002DD949C8|nr:MULTISPECIES: SDR family oxidoreductase [unclassified Streptomyces]WRZ97035.1 SDR family oxidoreductase [Streptomyces sp. NBC_00841]WSJ92777.1 SDR family oxidoreductase [Streptomyces sp. NBC_01320]
MNALNGIRVVVTGAGQGMGRTHCEHLARAGALIGALDIDADALAETRERVVGRGGQIEAVTCDVSNRAQVESAVARVAGRLGGIDAVVSNAGTIHTEQGLEDTDDEDWDRTMAVHVGGARNLCRAALPWLRRSAHPRIVIISSLWAQRGPGFGYAYCAAKGALLSFTRNLAVELGPEQILVNSVTPGSVPTRMAADYGPEEIAEDCKAIPMGRWGEAEEVSRLVAHLASPEASYVTGQNIAINGGQHFSGV